MKFKQTFIWQKSNSYWFWDRRGVLLEVFMNPGATVTWEVYCEIVKQLRRAIQNSQCGLLTSCVMFHDHVQPHTAVCAVQLLRQFK